MDIIKVGPVGRYSGGTIWDEKGRDKVAGIYVYYNKNKVLALEFLFYENGKLVLSNKYGDSGGYSNFSAVVFDYSSEFITSISGCFSYDYMKTIRFGTNKGYYGPFGCTSTHENDLDFNFQLGNHSLFAGFHGNSSNYSIISIGIYVKPVISSLTNLKDPRVKDEKV